MVTVNESKLQHITQSLAMLEKKEREDSLTKEEQDLMVHLKKERKNLFEDVDIK